MVTRSPTRIRFEFLSLLFWCIVPIGSIKDDIESAVAPDQAMFATLAKRAVKPAVGDPLVDGFHAQPEQFGELCRRHDDGETHCIGAGKSLLDVAWRQIAFPRAHCDSIREL